MNKVDFIGIGVFTSSAYQKVLNKIKELEGSGK